MCPASRAPSPPSSLRCTARRSASASTGGTETCDLGRRHTTSRRNLTRVVHGDRRARVSCTAQIGQPVLRRRERSGADGSGQRGEERMAVVHRLPTIVGSIAMASKRGAKPSPEVRGRASGCAAQFLRHRAGRSESCKHQRSKVSGLWTIRASNTECAYLDDCGASKPRCSRFEGAVDGDNYSHIQRKIDALKAKADGMRLTHRSVSKATLA